MKCCASSVMPESSGLFWLLWKSDIVHLAGPALVPLFLAWLLRKKAVIHHHGYQAVCPDGSLVHYVDQRNCCNSFAAGEVRECLRCRAANVGWLRGIVSVALAYPRLWLCRRVAANIAVSSHVKERLSLPRTTTIYNAPAEIPDCPADEFLSAKPSSPFRLGFRRTSDRLRRTPHFREGSSGPASCGGNSGRR